MIPGMMFLGSFAFPLATLVLFFELNTPSQCFPAYGGEAVSVRCVVSLGVALLGYTLPIFQLGHGKQGLSKRSPSC